MKWILILTSMIFISCAQKETKGNGQYGARLEGFAYPFTVANFDLLSQQKKLEMSYMDLSSEDNSRVVVLLHGKNFAGYYWKKIASKLNSNGYRVIIPDQVGFGKSSKPTNYQYSFPQLAINTMKLLESLNISKFTLVGHSMGGMLGITMANMFESKVEKLILINPIGLETYLDYVKFKDPDFFYQIEVSKSRQKMITYQKKNYYDGNWDDKYEQLLEPTIGQIQGNQWPLVAWNNALTYGPIFSEDMIPRLKALKIPSVLIIGTRDKTGPGRNWKKVGVTKKLGRYNLFGQKFKKLVKDAIVVELKNLGHMPQFEDYDLFSKVFYKHF